MIFFDNASTTRVREECAKIVEHYNHNEFFNPSSLYAPSIKVARRIKQARENLLEKLNGVGDIVFTSSGTESDNLALRGLSMPRYSNIIVSAVEHSAIFHTCNHLKQLGYEIRFCPCDKTGKIKLDELKKLLDEKTSLVSIMHICNETGAINDLKEIVKIVKSYRDDIIVHSDGVQALGKIKIDLLDLNVDLYSVSSHKINAPKGSGALYVKMGVNLFSILYGGGQEKGLRPSTENVSGILAFEKGCELALDEIEDNTNKYKSMIEKLKAGIMDIDENILIVSDEKCSPNILCFASKGVRGEVMLHALSEKNIYIGTGSACSSSKHTHRIPQAISLPKDYYDGVIRISLGKYNKIEEVDEFLGAFKDTYIQLAKFKRN